MPFKSLYPDIDIPQSNLLTNIFGNSDGSDLSDEPIWLNNKDPSKNLSLKQCLQYIKRLGCGLEQLGFQRQDVVVMCSPNHIFVPVAYLGLIGAGYIFSGVNPVYTASGTFCACRQIKYSYLGYSLLGIPDLQMERMYAAKLANIFCYAKLQKWPTSFPIQQPVLS